MMKANKKPKVLVIDNNEDAREIFYIRLLQHFDVQTVGYKEPYYNVIQQTNPHLILVDVGCTPDASLLERLANEGLHKPSIVTTAHDPSQAPTTQAMQQLAKSLYYATIMYTQEQLKSLQLPQPQTIDEVKANLNEGTYSPILEIKPIQDYQPLIKKIQRILEVTSNQS